MITVHILIALQNSHIIVGLYIYRTVQSFAINRCIIVHLKSDIKLAIVNLVDRVTSCADIILHHRLTVFHLFCCKALMETLQIC